MVRCGQSNLGCTAKPFIYDCILNTFFNKLNTPMHLWYKYLINYDCIILFKLLIKF